MRLTVRSPSRKVAEGEAAAGDGTESDVPAWVMSVMEISWTGLAGIWTRYIPAIILPNRNGLCGNLDNGSGPERSLRLRDGGTGRRISRCREAGWRLRVQHERGGAAAGGEAGCPAAYPGHAPHRPDRGG